MFKHFQSTSVVGWLLVAAISGTLFWLRPSTPQTLRPTVSEELFHGSLKVPAKLWQDPLEIGNARLQMWREDKNKKLSEIHKETSERLRNELNYRGLSGKVRGTDSQANAPVSEEQAQGGKVKLDSVGLFIITLPGGGEAEKRERRLRLRYATQAAMDYLGFRSWDAETLGVVPLQSRSGVDFDRVLVWEKWIRRPKAPDVGSHREARSSKVGDSKGPTNRDFESIVVVWLDEASWIDSSPMVEIASVKKQVLKSNSDAIIFGSGTESLLKVLEEEIESKGKPASSPEDPRQNSDVTGTDDFPQSEIYFPYSTVPAAAISKHFQKKSSHPRVLMKPGLNDVPIASHIWRPLISDDRLISALMQELSIRGISPGDHVVLITESDSLYGEEMANEFWRQWGQWQFAQEFRYVRGVDGNLPSVVQTTNPGSAAANPVSQLLQSWLQAKEPRWLLGRRQVDYIERIGSHIRKAGETPNSGPLRLPPKAIGIFGADVFDKQQILQVLKQQFPGTLFFTTDLDTLWNQNSDPLISRNLVVASAAGLVHPSKNTGKFGPFRDSYQTALYSCIISAVESAASDNKPRFERPDALVYEIGRTGNHPMTRSGLTSDFEARSLAEEPTDLAFATRYKQTSINQSLKRPQDRWAATMLCILAVGALALVLRMANLSQLALDWTKVALWGGLTAFGFVLCLWVLRVCGDSIWGDEAFHWIEGISVWPSVGVRLVATLLGVIFVTVMWGDRSWNTHASLETDFLQDVRLSIPWLFGTKFAFVSIVLAGLILSLVTLIPHLLDIRPAFFTPARGLAAMNAADVSLLLSLAAFYLAFASSGLMHFRLAYYLTHFLSEFEKHDWKVGDGQAVGLAKVVAERAKAAGNSILYPFALLAFLMIARSTIFDNWNFPTFLMVFVGVVSVLLIACGLALSAALREFRTLLEGSLPQTTPKEQLAALSPFLGSSWIESPALKAVAIAVGGIGIANLEQIFLSMK